MHPAAAAPIRHSIRRTRAAWDDAQMFFDNVSGLLRVLIVGSLAYVWLVAVLRVSGKRTLAQLNAFDFIVTVALGSTLATVALSSSVAWTEGALAVALLATLQFVAAWLAVRFSWARRGLTSEPVVLVHDGQLDLAALRRERISHQSLRQAVRASGTGGLEMIAAVVLETNGSLSVVTQAQLGDGSALRDVPGWREGSTEG